MANNHDIRTWALDQGIDVSGTGPIAADVKARYYAYQEGSRPDVDGEPAEPGPTSGPREQAPVIKKEGMAQRARRHWDESQKKANPRATRGRSRSKASHPRVSAERMIARGWSLLGDLAGTMLPATGRMIEIQAPIAGMLLDETVKDSFVDRLIQPAARAEQSVGVLGVLLGPVLAVAAIEMRPEQAPKVIKELRRQLMTWVEIAGPKLEAVMKREVEAEERYGTDVDSIIEDILSRIFVPEDAPS